MNKMNDAASDRILGKGEMADRVRAYDWRSTPLGPIEDWSKELVTIVNLTLASASPSRTMWGPQSILIYNDAYRPFPGPRHPAALGKPAQEVFEESWPVVGPLLERTLRTGTALFHEKLEVPLPAHDGIRNARLNYSVAPIYEERTVAGLFGAVHEVSNEVVPLHQLAESEARAARILQSIGDAVIVTDENACVTDMNHVAEGLTGWNLAEARGRLLSTVFRIVNENSRQPVESPADKVRRLGTVVGLANHTILIRKDGVDVPIDDSGAPIWDEDGKLTGIVLVFRDVTERKAAEQAVFDERAKLLGVLQQAPVFFALLQGPEHVISMANPLYLRLVNHREVLNNPFRIALPEAEEQGQIEILDRVYQGEPQVLTGSLCQTYDDDGLPGGERCIDFVYQPLREADGHVSGIIVVGVDVTDHKKAQETAERLAAIVESSDDVILSKDTSGIVTSWNGSASRVFGYTTGEMIGESIFKIIPADLQDEEKRIIESVCAGKRVEQFETVRLTKDGLIDVAVTVSPVRDDHGRVIGASTIMRDISDRKRVAQSLLQAEKIAATGRMAATIAHEINNPLEAVMNLLFLLRPKVADEEGIDYLSTAESELSRVSHIAKQTLGYYRETAAATPASLSDIAQHAISIYEPRCTAAGIRIQTSFRSTRKVVLRRGEMMQVISNLITNSIYAMPNGGLLTVSVEDTDEPASGILLTVCDDGVGIASYHLPKVFEAFFTTRSTVGNGIGLFVTKQFVELHGGEISITSTTDAENHGTAIKIFLPERTRYDVPQNA